MAQSRSNQPPSSTSAPTLSTSVDDLLAAAQARGDEGLETGRYIVTYKSGAAEAGMRSLSDQGLRIADARDFENQDVELDALGGAEVLAFPEIGSAVVSGSALQERSMEALMESMADGPIEAIEPEYFVFSQLDPNDYLKGFARAAAAIAEDLRSAEGEPAEGGEEVTVLGATWGLIRCKVPPSVRSGNGIKVAVLDTGMDLGHPDFAGRVIVPRSFVGQPVQDLHGHGTHCIGTACGPKAPPGTTPRYGIGFRTSIFVGKVLSNSGSGSTAGVLAGINWAIANRCTVISMSLGSQSPVQAAYTAAGAAALSKGCLIVAAAGNAGSQTGAPANSPTIMSVASLDSNLRPSSFSNFGKVEIAAPGRDVFSSVPRPARYGTKSGTSMATPHVAGCAALWAETSPTLRGAALWKKLQATARPLPFPASRVGAGLVQAP
jgi:subtilisin